MHTAACALRGSPSGGPVRSSASVDAAAGLAAPVSGFTSPLGACLRGRSILKVMAVEVQYSSNPYKYLAEERKNKKDGSTHLALVKMAINTANGGAVGVGGIRQLTCGKRISHCIRRLSSAPGCRGPGRPASKRSRFRSAQTKGERERHCMRTSKSRVGAQFPFPSQGLGGGGTHIVKSSEFVHQPVEFEQVEVPVAQDRPLVDGGS